MMTEDLRRVREEVDRLIEEQSYLPAARKLAEGWRMDSSPAGAGFVVARWERLRGHVPMLPYRLAILRSFTVEPAVPLLRASAFSVGIDLTVQLGDFNAYAQELLDAGKFVVSI